MKTILVTEYLHNEPKVYVPEGEGQHLHMKMKMVIAHWSLLKHKMQVS